jgi:hypothetical protein
MQDRSPYFGDLWMWGVDLGAGLGPKEPNQTSPKSIPNDPDQTSDNLKLQPHEL